MLQKSTILITGGGSAIGEALAVQLAKNNKVVICGRSEEKLKKVSSKHESISYAVADVSDYRSIDKLFSSFKENGIAFNVLFNNAGVVELWDLNKMTLTSREIFEKINTNLSGAVALTQHFIKQANHSVENLIVNNTSEIAIMPVPLLALYSSSKTGLSVFTKVLRIQLKNTKFRVVELLSPGVDTEMPKRLYNTGKLLNVDAFASNVIRVISQGKTEYAPGKDVPLLKFFQKFLPVIGLNLIDKLSRKQLGYENVNDKVA
jgi:uncharacterized oxidoreductase